MIERKAYSVGAGSLVIWLCLQAFFSVLALVDGAEQRRAWKAATAWTAEERDAADAPDPAPLLALSNSCNGSCVAVASLSFLGLFFLGLSAAGKNPSAGFSRAAYRLSEGAVIASAALGLGFAGMTLAYRISLGGRTMLKGPVRDFSLVIEPTIAVATVGLAAVGAWSIAAFIAAARRRLAT